MPIEKTNPITGYEINIITPTPAVPKLNGWIRLLNGALDSGYVYLTDTPVRPRLGGGGSYIVTSVPLDKIEFLLCALRNERNLQIRYFDSQVEGGSLSVHIEPRDSAAEVPADVAEELARIV
jgi:hypothetical protein